MPSLREQQLRFAEAILGADDAATPGGLLACADAARGLSIYRNNVFSNYRNALGASYPVVCRLVGRSFFDTAVDAFARARPSTAGDLNGYGGDFGDFLLGYPYARDLPYLADVARLEWALDEAQRAADHPRSAREVLSALAAIEPGRLPSVAIELDPSCRLVASAFPVLRIWRVNQPDYAGDGRVDLDAGGERLLVRRDAAAVTVERVGTGAFALLRSLQSGATLGAAFESAQDADAAFDLGAALRDHIAAGTLVRVGLG